MADPPLKVMAFAPNPWQGPWMNRQQLLTRLAAREYPVLFSNGLWRVWDRRRADWQRAPSMGRWQMRDGVLVDEAPKWLMRWPGHRIWDSLANRIGAWRWKHQLSQQIAPNGITYLFHPAYLPAAKALGQPFLVYHAYDLLWERANRSQRSQLQETLELADLVIASSQPIARELETVSGRRDVRVLPNGVDFPVFARGEGEPEPADLKEIPRPRILYAGNLNRKVDLPLIRELALNQPDWQFILVGGRGNLDSEVARAWPQCEEQPNVHFLGPKHHTELPAYMGHADVNVMAYRQGQGLWTHGGYPLKLHEYLAAGKPVVSTPLATVAAFKEVVALASGAEQWEQALRLAIREGGVGTPEQRRKVATENSWSLRVDDLESWLRELVGAPPLSGSRFPAGDSSIGLAGDGSVTSASPLTR